MRAEAQRLVAICEDASWIGFTKNAPAPGNFRDWKREAKLFEDMAATSFRRAALTGGNPPEEVARRNVTPNVFRMLGVKPLLGRWLEDREDVINPSAVVISEGLWNRRFGADPKLDARCVPLSGSWPRRSKSCKASRRINEANPNVTDPRMTTDLGTLRDQLLGKTQVALWGLMGAAAMVLLIACANVANLLLTRATGRQRELAIRSALSASTAHLIEMIFAETLAQTLAGGALGVGLAASARVLDSAEPGGRGANRSAGDVCDLVVHD
jgi:hypothetical protein